jgi:hypothetical protein
MLIILVELLTITVAVYIIVRSLLKTRWLAPIFNALLMGLYLAVLGVFSYLTFHVGVRLALNDASLYISAALGVLIGKESISILETRFHRIPFNRRTTPQNKQHTQRGRQ